ncbi:MAG: cell division ATP-binding protein FtsE [Oscillospiraceae bacterium]|nr:cell division ATP-binding protein FtsE [Oscillospiraceae bacterium]
MLTFRGVTKVYPNGTVALDDVSFSIAKGEFAFVIGSSGSGKSTLIRLLMKEEDLTGGRIGVNGKDIGLLDRRETPYYRRQLGVVFQDFRLLNDRTAYENVAFAMHIAGAAPRQIRRQVPMALSLVGLAKKSHCHPAELSGGEQQRIAIARAIANNPLILLADEPTGNLDPENSWDIMGIMSELNGMGTTLLIATHEKSIVDRLSKRVISLEAGRVAHDVEKGRYV